MEWYLWLLLALGTSTILTLGCMIYDCGLRGAFSQLINDNIIPALKAIRHLAGFVTLLIFGWMFFLVAEIGERIVWYKENKLREKAKKEVTTPPESIN